VPSESIRETVLPLYTHAPISEFIYLLAGASMNPNGEGTYSLCADDIGWPRFRLIASKEVLEAVQGAYDSSSDEDDGEEELVEMEEGTGVRKRKPRRPRGAAKSKPAQKKKKRKKKAPKAVPSKARENLDQATQSSKGKEVPRSKKK
jgi:hypothetical protein